MGVPRTTKDGKTYKTQHYANGTPAINPKFPDIAGLVKYGHSRGLKMGWYENGCACGEKIELTINYEGDVKLLHDFGFFFATWIDNARRAGISRHTRNRS